MSESYASNVDMGDINVDMQVDSIEFTDIIRQIIDETILARVFQYIDEKQA